MRRRRDGAAHTGDHGDHHAVYSFLPHPCGFSAEAVVRPAYQLNYHPVYAGGAFDLPQIANVDKPNIIIETIKQFYSDIEYIKAPGALEGGDVMMVGDCFYVGRSARTNAEGIRQFAAILARYGFDCVEVPLEKVLHLKTGVNYIENNNMLVSGEFVEKECFAKFNHIVIPESEAYAANCIWMNGTVIVPEGYPATLKAIQDAGYPTITVDTSEFRKIDGGLSCLSLRF